MIDVPLAWEQGSISSTITGAATASPRINADFIFINIDNRLPQALSYRNFDRECRIYNESNIDLPHNSGNPLFTLISFSEWDDSSFDQLFRSSHGTLPAGGNESWGGLADGPKRGFWNSLIVRLRTVDVKVPRASVTAPTDIRVRMSCAYRLFDPIDGEAFKYEISATASASILPKTKVHIELPSSLSFGSLPVGGGAIRELPLTIRSDGAYSGVISYAADVHDGGINAKIGDGDLRLAYGTGHSAVGYANLTGLSGINISGTSGDKILMHSVYLNVPQNARLGSYRTNLRVTLRYF